MDDDDDEDGEDDADDSALLLSSVGVTTGGVTGAGVVGGVARAWARSREHAPAMALALKPEPEREREPLRGEQEEEGGVLGGGAVTQGPVRTSTAVGRCAGSTESSRDSNDFKPGGMGMDRGAGANKINRGQH